MAGAQLSAVIPTLNSGQLLDRCLDALEQSDSIGEVLVLDGGSADGSPERAAQRDGVQVSRWPGTSFQRRLNHGVEQATGEFILYLNDDAFVDPDTPRKLLEVLQDDPRVAVAEAALRYEDGRPQRSVGQYRTLLTEMLSVLFLPRLGHRFARIPIPARRESGVDAAGWLPLCCSVWRRSAVQSVGGFDERFSFYYDDHDFCRRLVDAGWRLVVRWDAGAVHLGGGATSSKDRAGWFRRYHENRLIFLRKHYPRAWRVFWIAWPPRAILHVTLWRLRALRSRRRGQSDDEQVARQWAQAFQATLRAGPGERAGT
jgi:GT2 family glycosyltransferase